MKLKLKLLALVVLAGSGCADIEPSRILHPGPAWYQQEQAEKFDPYPATDIGPEMAGTRPLAYARPAPENERVQNANTFFDRYKQAPPPGLYRPPREPTLQQAVPFVPAQPVIETAPPYAPPSYPPPSYPPPSYPPPAYAPPYVPQS